MQITLLLFLSFTLTIVSWIPSLIVESIVNVTIIILILLSVFLVYKTIRISYEEQKKKVLWKSILYTVGYLLYIGLFVIFIIGIAYSKSTYVKQYTFDEKVFYVYQDMRLSYEVSVKESILPIRSVPIADSFYMPIVLEKQENYLYATGEGIHIKVYDFTNNSVMKN